MNLKSKSKCLSKQIGKLLCVLFIALYIGVCCLQNNDGTEYKAVIYVLLFITTVIFEVLPTMVTCFLAIGLLPLLGLASDMGEALVGFSNPVIAFIVASFGIVQALSNTSFVDRVMKKFLSGEHIDADQLTWKMMVCTSLMSSIVSNVPTCALFFSIAKKMLDVITEEKRNAIAKKWMIGIPVSSMIGGIITPVGSSVNILAISLLENQTGVRISFVQWMAMGLPVALIAIPICWLLLKRLDVNVKLEKNETVKILSELHQCEKTESKDFRTLFYIGAMLAFWIASSWVKYLNVVDITVIGCAVMCIPHIGVVKIDDVVESINWKSVILLGSVLTIGTLLTRNDIFSMFPCETLQTFSLNIPHLVLYAVTAFISFVLLIVIPVAPSMETFWIPFALSAFCSNGVNPALVTAIIAICACNCYLFPFDTVFLITYGSGYYSMKDLFKVSIPLQLCVVIVCAAVVYLNELILW